MRQVGGARLGAGRRAPGGQDLRDVPSQEGRPVNPDQESGCAYLGIAGAIVILVVFALAVSHFLGWW